MNDDYSVILGRNFCQKNWNRYFGLPKGLSPRLYRSERGTKRSLDTSCNRPFLGEEKKQELEAKDKILETKYEKNDLEKTSKSLDHLNHDKYKHVLEVLKNTRMIFKGQEGIGEEDSLNKIKRKELNLSMKKIFQDLTSIQRFSQERS